MTNKKKDPIAGLFFYGFSSISIEISSQLCYYNDVERIRPERGNECEVIR